MDSINYEKDRQFRISKDEIIAFLQYKLPGEKLSDFVHLSIRELLAKRRRNGNGTRKDDLPDLR